MTIFDLKKVAETLSTRRDAHSKTEIEAMFAQASALFAAKRYQKAASVYVATVPLSRANNIPTLTMEAWLMGAYCQEIAGNIGWALAFARVALHHAEKIPQTLRPASIIANIGESLIRYIRNIQQTESPMGIPSEDEINKRMVLLLGESWRQRSVTLEQLLGASAIRFGCNPEHHCSQRYVPGTVAHGTEAPFLS